MTGYQKYKRKRKRHILLKIIGIILIILVLAVAAAYYFNRIVSVKVTGNEHYTEDEIKNMIIDGNLEHNAWYLFWKYNYTKTKKIPFVDTVEVSLTGRGKVKITIYEKGIVGCVECLGSYMYFDKDGVVVESSTERMEDIPLVEGLKFNKIVLYEPLPVKRGQVFDSIMNLTKLLAKYKIKPDHISYEEDLEATLFFGKARVKVGADTNMNEKIARLACLVENIKDRSGTLHMENIEEDTQNITFEMDE